MVSPIGVPAPTRTSRSFSSRVSIDDLLQMERDYRECGPDGTPNLGKAGLRLLAVAQRVADILALGPDHGRLLREGDDLFAVIADDAQGIAALGHGRQGFPHHLPHLDDAAVRDAQMLVGAIGDGALLLD